MLRALLRSPVNAELRRYASGFSGRIRVGDNVLLRVHDTRKSPVYTKELRPGGATDTRWGRLEHDELIGKSDRDTISTHKGNELRVHLPTLEEYVLLSSRNVTPVYPDYAHLIVSLLDIHVSPPHDTQHTAPDLEILEAGTGNGGLTLYLARAIHAANPAISSEVLQHMLTKRIGPIPGQTAPIKIETDTPDTMQPSIRGSGPYMLPDAYTGEAGNVVEEYKGRRKAVLHTLDNIANHSLHARKLITGFRQGIYAPSIDFHVGDIGAWLAAQSATRQSGPHAPTSQNGDFSSEVSPFLDHVLLDLPNVHCSLVSTSRALKTGGALVVFAPNVTQIQTCVELVRKERLALVMDRVLELGTGISGGREWDVRSTRPRALKKDKKQALTSVEHDVHEAVEPLDLIDANPVAAENVADDPASSTFSVDASPGDEGFEMICRPKVGARVVGGGFVAVWRKMRYDTKSETPHNTRSEIKINVL